MIHPIRDLYLALALLTSGVAAVALGHPAIFDESAHKALHATVAIGALATIIGFFASLNFALAVQITRRMRKSNEVIARWNISPALMQLYVDSEARREGTRPHWRPSGADVENGLEVILAPESVLIGGRLMSAPSSGMQSIRAVRIVSALPPVIEFQTLLYTVTTRGNSERLTTTKGLLRVPAPTMADAETVRRFYQDVIDGVRLIAPRRWKTRVVGGLAVAAFSSMLFVAGLVLGKFTGFSGGPYGPLPDLLIFVSVFGFIGGLIVAFIASRFYATQHRRR